MKINSTNTNLATAVLSLGLTLSQISGAQNSVPVGEGAVPVGEGAVRVGEGTVPVGEGAVPVGEDAVPVGEHAVPVGEGAVAVGEGAHYTNRNEGRFSRLVAAVRHPDTAPLFDGDRKSRHDSVRKRLIAALQKSSSPAAADAREATRARHDAQWGRSARAATGSNPEALFTKAWWEEGDGGIKIPGFYFSTGSAASWWKHADWKALSGATGIKDAPYYYDYGRNITFQGDVIYVDGQSIATYRDAADTARRLAAMPGVASKWTPLGTFILSQNPAVQKISIGIQLVAGNDGTISGSYHNWDSKRSEPIHGTVDRDTQRVAFQITGSKITMETGLANLTRDEARLWAHLPDGRCPIWLLARLPEQKR